MKATTITLSSVAFTAAAVVTYFVLRAFQSEMTSLSLVVGAIVGTQVGVILHHRQTGALLTPRIKVWLGAVAAVTGVVLSLIMQAAFQWFRFPEVSIPIGAVGCFVFPFVISGNLWKALEKSKKKDNG